MPYAIVLEITIVLIATFVLTVVFDLVVAIGVGILLVCVLFVKRMSEESSIRAWVEADQVEIGSGVAIPPQTRVFELDGPLFFGVAEKLMQSLNYENCKCLVLRMRSVSCVDVTALGALEQIYAGCAKHGITMILSHMNAQPESMLQKAGFLDKIGADNCCRNIRQALARAQAIVGGTAAPADAGHTPKAQAQTAAI